MTPATDASPLMATYPPPPVTFVRGQGSYLWDDAGRRYLDLLSGLAVTSLGHAHPAVTEALATQAATLVHVSNLFGTEVGAEVARTLDRLVGDGVPVGGQVFFCNSGAEANECAIKLARRFGGRGRHVVVSAYGGFHGRTLATLHATGQPEKHEPFQPLPEGFRHVAWDDLDALDAALDPTVAAVLLEPVQGEGGVNPASRRVLPGRAAAVRRAGRAVHGRRGADRPRPHRPLVRLPAPGRAARRGHHGQGARQRRAHRRLLGPAGGVGGVRVRATTPPPTAASRSPPPQPGPCSPPCRPRTPRPGPPGSGVRLAGALAALPGVAGVRGQGLLLAVELDGLDARQVNAALLDAGVVANAVTPTALRLAPSLLIEDAQIDDAVAIVADVLRAALAATAAAGSAR